MRKSKIFLTLIISLLFIISLTAQSSKYHFLTDESWSGGFGFNYPRYLSSDLYVNDKGNYGAFLSIQKNFSEHVGVRLEGQYIHLQGESVGTKVTNTTLAGNFNLVYYLIPCEPISPFLAIGFGGIYYTVKNSPIVTLNKSLFDYQFNLNFGAEWLINNEWKLKTELGYFTPATGSFDGISGFGNGLLGGPNDTYMLFDVGVLYYFNKGERSRLCDIYDGIDPKVDYNKIEEIVKKYAAPATEVDYNRIEDIVKRNKATFETGVKENWVLIGVNFDFNKSTLRPEALPILYNAAEILLVHPNIKVEIQGHTDNAGSESYNKQLSLQRAEAVKNFLIAKGVDSNRLTAIGMGESKPIADNNTAQGRELNRRIEFRILSR